MPDDKSRLEQDLQTALENKQTFELGDLVEKAQEAYPNEAFTFRYAAEYHLLRWNYSEAIEQLEKALNLASDSVDLKLKLAFAKNKNYDQEGAKAIYTALEQDHQHNSKVLLALGRFYTEDRQAQKAIELLDKVIAEAYKLAESLALRAKAYSQDGQYDKALDDINQVIEVNPEDAKVYEERIQINKGKNDKAAVVADYEKLHELDPKSSVHTSNWGHYLMQVEDFAAAIEAYSKSIALEKEKGWTPNYLDRGKAYLNNNQHEKAIADFEQQLASDSKNSSVHEPMAKALEAVGKLEQALEHINKAIEGTSFQKSRLILKRGNIYAKLENYDAAIADFEQVSEDRFSKRDGLFELGNVYQQKGDLKAAYKAWKEADTNHHPDAQAKIDEYCKEVIADAESEAKAAIMQKFEADFEQNKQSPFLQKLIGKVWMIDKEATVANNEETLGKIPENFREMMLSTLDNVTVVVSHKAFVFMMPTGDDIEAYFRIENETENQLDIFGEPTNGKPPKPLSLFLTNEHLILQGLQKEIKLHLKEVDPKTVENIDKEAFEQKMRNLATNFVSEIFETLADQLK